MKKFCSNCREWQESWADHSSYKSYSTYKRYERCWKCDEWTLSDRTIFVPRSSVVSRESVQEGLDNVRSGRSSRFTCGKLRRDSNTGEWVHETLVYNGGGTYTRIVDRDGRETIETRRLETFTEVFFLEIMEAVIGVESRAICPMQ